MLSASLDLLAGEPTILYPAAFGIGAILGSFLTVVVARLPVMMANQAEAEARAVLEDQDCGPEPAERFDLAWPASHCPSCRHKLRWYENLPILSFLIQRGRCRACKTSVPWRYPLLELASGALVVLAVGVFGPTLQGAAAAVLLLALLAITGIDLEHQLVPDAIVLPMLWVGLGLNAFGVFVSAESAILGAVAGFGSLWAIYAFYRLLTGQEAIGRGDLKLAAMIGAWLGVGAMPGILFIAFASGALIGLGLMIGRRAGFGTAVPFGPFLALGAACGVLAPGFFAVLNGLFLP